MITIFERPLLPGWVYPCTVEDIRQQLTTLPAEDLEGLWAVGLVPSTRKGRFNGLYWGGDKPYIHILSYEEGLRYRYAGRARRGDLERDQTLELQFGMRIEQRGNRWWCVWSPEDLRRYTLEHVLIHEVGHHVQHMQQPHPWFQPRLSDRAVERFAEEYALRYLRERRGANRSTAQRHSVRPIP